MPKKYTEALIKNNLQILSETSPRIRACAAGIDETRLATPPAPGEWSVLQILAHVRSGVDVWSFSIYAMLTYNNPELGFIHPRDWDKMQGYASLTFAENMQAFDIARTNLLRILKGLSFDDWGRTARLLGKVNIHSVFDETVRMASHEADHSKQIESMLK